MDQFGSVVGKQDLSKLMPLVHFLPVYPVQVMKEGNGVKAKARPGAYQSGPMSFVGSFGASGSARHGQAIPLEFQPNESCFFYGYYTLFPPHCLEVVRNRASLALKSVERD